jgi:hypothetical protein
MGPLVLSLMKKRGVSNMRTLELSGSAVLVVLATLASETLVVHPGIVAAMMLYASLALTLVALPICLVWLTAAGIAKNREKGSEGAGESKTNALNAGHQVEMRIIAQYGQPMLTSQSRNPSVIGGDRRRSIPQLTPQFRVMNCRLLGNLQNPPLPRQRCLETMALWGSAARIPSSRPAFAGAMRLDV